MFKVSSETTVQMDVYKNNKWSKEEDNILKTFVKQNGTDKWSLCSQHMKNTKSRKQCRQRYLTLINEDKKRGDWSRLEDYIIIKTYKLIGARWLQISELLDNRTSTLAKNRFYFLLNKERKKSHFASQKEQSITCLIENNSDVKYIDSLLCSNGIFKLPNYPELNYGWLKSNLSLANQCLADDDNVNDDQIMQDLLSVNYFENLVTDGNHNLNLERECIKLNNLS